MRIGQNDIIEELTAHMRKLGGEPGEWQVGAAAPNAKLPSQNSRETNLPGLACREAYTNYAAAEAVDYLVSAFGLHPARGLSCAPGSIVFVYRTPEKRG